MFVAEKHVPFLSREQDGHARCSYANSALRAFDEAFVSDAEKSHCHFRAVNAAQVVASPAYYRSHWCKNAGRLKLRPEIATADGKIDAWTHDNSGTDWNTLSSARFCFLSGVCRCVLPFAWRTRWPGFCTTCCPGNGLDTPFLPKTYVQLSGGICWKNGLTR